MFVEKSISTGNGIEPDKLLAANVFERFPRKLSGIDFLHAAII